MIIKKIKNFLVKYYVPIVISFSLTFITFLATNLRESYNTSPQQTATQTQAQTRYTGSLAQTPNSNKIKYTKFLDMISKNEVSQVILDPSSPQIRLTSKDGKTYVTDNPETANFKEFLLKNNIDVVAVNEFQAIIFELIALGLFLWGIYHLVKSRGVKMRTGNIELTRMGLVSIKEVRNIPDITFDDIAGNYTIKKDVNFIIDFLKNPNKYEEIGARLPKGIIFYGPPGTGKTLCAKAIAGEAGVPFFSTSGSDFVEMYVGVGARRVRELFEQARRKAPCIIFIDELDSVGKKRGIDSHSERDQTINALLTELDGFSSSEGIVVIGATNQIEMLDEALTRPGRFDKSLAIPLPEYSERVDILKLHAKNKRLSLDVNLNKIAQTTIGFSGAGLETLLNESAIIAVNKGHTEISMEDIDDAYYKIIMKGDKKSTKDVKTEQLKLVAWHEAGHALVAKLLTKKSVPKVSIVPSTSGAGGVTFIIPDKNGLHTKRDIINDIKISYGGRIGEYLLTKSEDLVTTGASVDIRQATDSLTSMIKEFGMSDEMGMLYVNALKGNDTKVNLEAKKLSKEFYQQTLELLQRNTKTLETIANHLLAKEVIEEEELDDIISNCSGE